MRVLSTNFESWKNQLRGLKAFVWLFDLSRDSSNVSRYCRERADVTFNGNTYTRKEIKFEPPSSDSQGTFHDFAVQIGDADRTEKAYLLNSKYRDQPMAVRLVNLEDLSNSDDQLLYRAKIKSASTDETKAILRCGPHNLHKATVPYIILIALRCRFRFKGWRCQYAGAETSCDLRFETCRDTMSNQDRFGGTPFQQIFRP